MAIDVRPFRFDVPQAHLDRIRAKLAAADFTYAPADDGEWRYGADVGYLKSFVDHWLNRYDWRAAETALNRFPQFKAAIDGLDIHFHHVRGEGPVPLPLVLTHGWPGSTFEFFAVIERLADPARFGGDPRDAFDVIVPSLPGYGPSQRPQTPLGPRRTAALWRKLMVDALGYKRFVAQGGDWGSAVTSWLGAEAPEVAGIHLNLCVPPAIAPEEMSAEEREWRARFEAVQRQASAYMMLHMTKPQTIAIALSDTPMGYAAWVLEKYHGWGDTRGDIESRFSKDDLITNLMIHLTNDAVTSMIWSYVGAAIEARRGEHAGLRVDKPTAVALYPAEFLPPPPRRVAERVWNITRWVEMSAGGHFAAFEEPEAFAADVAAAFRPLR
ncbi:MAG: epoxide hydrolase [Hydrogenophilaceae bacterium]|jgi:microsomal epoxide hydrolase|nr:epoxide hydrolase [Hydrogenophilaceae bacterium]